MSISKVALKTAQTGFFIAFFFYFLTLVSHHPADSVARRRSEARRCDPNFCQPALDGDLRGFVEVSREEATNRLLTQIYDARNVDRTIWQLLIGLACQGILESRDYFRGQPTRVRWYNLCWDRNALSDIESHFTYYLAGKLHC